MEIVGTVPVSQCLGGLTTREYTLGSAMTRPFIEYLGSIGTIEYFPRLARPFFRVSRPGSFIVKGVEGDLMMQVSYLGEPRVCEDEILSRIRLFGT